MNTIDIYKWAKERIDSGEMSCMSNLPINAQIDRLESCGYGVGLIGMLANIEIEDDNDDVVTTQEVVFIPVAKIHKRWLTFNDEEEELNNIFMPIIRMLNSNE